MEREIKRGDIYEVLFGDELTTLCAHRPMLVVSCNKANAGNTPYVMVIPLTTKFRYGVISPIINSMGKQAWSKCDQVQCVAKERLEQYKCSATEAEMEAVDRGLRSALWLNFTAEEEDAEKARLEKEIESLKAQLESKEKEKEDSDTSMVVSRDMYKRLYEKALEELSSVRFGFDLENKVVEKPKVKVAEEPKVSVVVKPPEVEEPKVEINTCSEEDLRRIGLNPTMIFNLIQKRPYKSVEDLKVVPGFTRIGYKLIEGRVCCVPVITQKKSSGKLNINTATVEEMKEVLGLSTTTAQSIRAYRNKNGNFKSLEELTNVPRFGYICLQKYGPKMEV